MRRITSWLYVSAFLACCISWAASPIYAAASAPSPLSSLHPSISLLDQNGHLARPVNANMVAEWKREIAMPGMLSDLVMRDHIWIGEYDLSHDLQPIEAISQFDAALKQTDADKALLGLATYDTAIAMYARGAYTDATNLFMTLDSPKTALSGYDRRACALWLRNAGACAGYHAQHAEQGIPEAPYLDP